MITCFQKFIFSIEINIIFEIFFTGNGDPVNCIPRVVYMNISNANHSLNFWSSQILDKFNFSKVANLNPALNIFLLLRKHENICLYSRTAELIEVKLVNQIDFVVSEVYKYTALNNSKSFPRNRTFS